VQIGVAAAVHGSVEIVSSHQAIGRVVESGKPIYLGDVVKTGTEGRLQILLLDQTVFTIGPNSAITIDEFVYDPETHEGRLTANVIEGFFRFVSGKIAKNNPKNMNVKLPTGTIGIRGTIVTGQVSGMESLVALRGPGPENRVGATIGKIEVSNAVNNQVHRVHINRPGFGTTIPGLNQPPTPPALVPAEVLQAIDQNLNQPQPAPQPPQPGEQQPTAQQQKDAPAQEPKAPTDGPNSGNYPPQPGEPSNPNQPPAPGGYAPGPYPSAPPSEAQLQAMYAAGEITEDELDTMMADMQAWQNGDEATRAELDAKYADSTHSGPNPHNNYFGPTTNSTATPPGTYSPEAYQNNSYNYSGTPNNTFYTPMEAPYAPPTAPLDPTTTYYTPDSTYPDPFVSFDPNPYFNSSTQDAQASANNSGQILDGISTKEQLTSVQTGQFHFLGSGAFTQTQKANTTADISGTMTVRLNIDFGARTFGGSGSKVTFDTTPNGGSINQNVGIPSQGFGSGTGSAVYDLTNSTGTTNTHIVFENRGGLIGTQADVSVTYNNSSTGDVGSGAVNDISRQPGNI
jgi:hypothetical protein